MIAFEIFSSRSLLRLKFFYRDRFRDRSLAKVPQEIELHQT